MSAHDPGTSRRMSAHDPDRSHRRAAPPSACDRCLARPWLLSRLSAHLDRVRGRIQEVLTLGDEQLVEAVAGRDADRIARERDAFDPRVSRERAAAAGLQSICCCSPRYPRRLRSVAGAPTMLFVTGELFSFLELCEADPVAIVGSRRASSYGLEVARSLGRELGRAGLPVISGMAIGVDAAAHEGAIEAQAPTIAVLPGSPDRPTPASKRALHRSIVSGGAALSEAGPGSQVRPWCFTARNRVVAGLAAMTVVVEASERSGALLTARIAGELGRRVGAVPGRVDSPNATGPNGLLAGGATVVRSAQDIVDSLYGAGRVTVAADQRPALSGEGRRVYEALAAGGDVASALAGVGVALSRGLAILSELELAGHIRRIGAGRYAVIP